MTKLGDLMKIRNLSEDDIITIIKVTESYEDLLVERSSIYWLFWKFFKDTCLVALEENQLIGYLLGFISQTEPICGYIHMIGVNKNYRRKRIGTTLINYFEEIVASKGAKFIYLTTNLENVGAIEFYKEIGFNDINKIYKVGSERLEFWRKISSYI